MNDEIADVFGLNYAQKRFVRDAIAGSDEKGYSQAMLSVDGEWRGMEVLALPRETAVIENDVDLEPFAKSEGEQNVSKALDDD